MRSNEKNVKGLVAERSWVRIPMKVNGRAKFFQKLTGFELGTSLFNAAGTVLESPDLTFESGQECHDGWFFSSASWSPRSVPSD